MAILTDWLYFNHVVHLNCTLPDTWCINPIVQHQSVFLSVIPFRLSATYCTSKVLTNMSLTPAGRASTLWRNQWKTEWEIRHFIVLWLLLYLSLSREGRKRHALSSSKLTLDTLLILIIQLMCKTDLQFKVYNALLLYLQLHGRKQHIRALLIDRVMLQHEVSC